MSIKFIVNHGVPAVFGPGSSQTTGERMKALGASRVLVVCDQGIAGAGLTLPVEDSIRRAGLTAIRYSDAELEPTCASFDRAAEAAREAKADGIVGVGGGSSMDTAKGVSLLLSNGGRMYDWLCKPNVRTYPLICVPTTSGTSSEVAPNCAVTDDRTGDKLYSPHSATLAIVDPELQVGCPPFVTACCGFDMLAHTIESYTNPNMEHWMSDFMDETTIKLAYRWLPKAVRDGSDLEARTWISFACLNTGYAFGDKGTHLGHAISDTIHLLDHRVSHGLGCAFALPVVIRHCAVTDPQKIRRVGEKAGLTLPEHFSCQQVGDYVANAFRDLMRACGIQNLRTYQVTEDCMDQVIEELPHNFRFAGQGGVMDFQSIGELIRSEWQHA